MRITRRLAESKTIGKCGRRLEPEWYQWWRGPACRMRASAGSLNREHNLRTRSRVSFLSPPRNIDSSLGRSSSPFRCARSAILFPNPRIGNYAFPGFAFYLTNGVGVHHYVREDLHHNSGGKIARDCIWDFSSVDSGKKDRGTRRAKRSRNAGSSLVRE